MRRAALLAAVAVLAGAAPAGAATLRVGVGRADVTPPTGVFKGGWACSCAKAQGQHTRLYFRAVLLEQGDQRLALVNADLAFFGLGMLRDAVKQVPGRGFTEQNVIVSATHTHSSQTGYMNFASFNSVLPSFASLSEVGAATPTDQTMYSFMVRQLANALARADANLKAGALGWGRAELYGVTKNRSLEAHLANYGIKADPGKGSVDQAPGGYRATIDPAVDVLRVDRYEGPRRIPVGMFSTFANHGTVVRHTFPYYSADHNAAAERVVEADIRRIGKVPRRQDVVNAFGNSDAGDMSAGLDHFGPADAESVGRREATAMLRAWRAAGRAMTRRPALGLRTTIVGMRGRETSEGPTDQSAVIGLAAASGSEELRTIFYDAGVAREGHALPVSAGPQGVKFPTINQTDSVPTAVPLHVARIGSRAVATVPGEPTVGLGRMLRGAVRERIGVSQVVLAGFANEYLDYWVTPAEYDRQHYEGGFAMYGRTGALLLRDRLADLAGRLASGQPAPTPDAYDANAGVHASAADYGAGAGTARAVAQPRGVERLGHASFSWSGGANGVDRPVDRAFVTIQRQTQGRWRMVADDLGMQIVWEVDGAGAHRARWEVPLSAPAGRYRFRVTAKRYELASQPFEVARGRLLTPVAGDAAVALHYPKARIDADWTYRPAVATGGAVSFSVDGRRVVVRAKRGTRFAIPDGDHVTIPAGGAHDRHGNLNARELTIR